MQSEEPSRLVSGPVASEGPQDQKVPADKSGIRLVDFRNFEYPATPIYSDSESTFRLKDGKFEGRQYQGVAESETLYLSQKTYGDLTRDGVEEAILVLIKNVRGSAIPYYVYIYTLHGEKPRLLWAFSTGDRADGGRRRVYAVDTNLTVELYGKETVVNGNLKDQDELGACCPKSFTRTVYDWNGRSFQQKGSNEIIPEPNATGDLLPPPNN